MIKRIEHTVPEAGEGRVDVTVARLTDSPRSRVRGLIDHGGVTVNGETVEDHGQSLRPGDVVVISHDPERKYREAPAPRATRGFTLIHVDDHLVVVCKDAGILTVPTDRGEKNTLIELVSGHLAKGQARRRRVSVVHRLDRETSGLLVFGRTPDVARAISDQFAARKPEREYAAIVAGRLADDEGTIRSRLVTDKALNQRSVQSGEGELAVTHYRVRERFTDATAVAVRLETGRRNQIRVHFAELGHPVLGDTRYRPELAAHPSWRFPRLALHARVLGFRHPVTGKQLRFEAPLPREIQGFRG